MCWSIGSGGRFRKVLEGCGARSRRFQKGSGSGGKFRGDPARAGVRAGGSGGRVEGSTESGAATLTRGQPCDCLNTGW